jgi:sec-independent protein translocase protein TatA
MGLDNPVHILLLLIVLLLVFGARRLPEMGRSLGEGLRGFKDTLTGEAPRETVTQSGSASSPAASVPAASELGGDDHVPRDR